MKWKTDLPNFGRKYSCTLLLWLLFAAHLPFLAADPDANISFSRGPFTDEGLNTIQVRNWINHGDLDLAECDNLLKTPLLGFSLALTYKVFGTGHIVSRLHVLLFLLAAMSFICLDRKNRRFLIIFIGTTLMQYQVFQFSHFSLAEMLSCASILLAVHFLAKSADLQFDQTVRRNYAILAGVFLSLSWFFKIQFIYLAVLFPLAQLSYLPVAKPLTKKLIIRQGMFTSATLLIFLFVYFIAWYLPNREIYDFIMASQSGEFSISGKSLEYLGFNLSQFFLRGWILIFVVVFLASFAAGLFLLRKKSHTSRFPILFLTSSFWFLLETHKLLMVYLPTRYRISLYVSMGLLISVVISEILSNRKMSKPAGKQLFLLKSFAIGSLVILLAINTFNYFSTLKNRTFVIRDMNAYLAESMKPDDVALGAWAPSLTWESKARALPVWNNFLNYKDPINTFNPRVIIAETDEQDSEQAYKSQGINLHELADSTKTAMIGSWEVRIYWMPGPHPVPPPTGGAIQGGG